MNVTASGSLVFCTFQHNHAQLIVKTHTQRKKKLNSQKFKIKKMEVCKVMAHSFRRKNMMEK